MRRRDEDTRRSRRLFINPVQGHTFRGAPVHFDPLERTQCNIHTRPVFI